MKTLWAILSAKKPYTFILSISIHMLVFLIPISLVVAPQVQEMELFLSMEGIQVPPEPVKERITIKKPHPQSEPVKEMIKPIEPSQPKIQNPEIVEQVEEVVKEPPFIPAKLSITEKNSHEPVESGATEMASGIEEEPLISYPVAGNDTGTPIETIFGASVAPAFLHKEMPIYPMMARKLGREGRVILKLTIDEKGNLLNIEVMEKAGYGFTEAAVEAVKKSTFLSAKKDGKPIASRALLPIRFRLERS